MEDGAEAAVDLVLETLPQLIELCRCGLEVAQLRSQAIAAVTHLRILLGREEIDRAHRIEPSLQARDLTLRLLPVDVLDRLAVVLDLLAALAERERATVNLDLRGFAVGDRRRPGIVGVSELDLQRDVALFVFSELCLQGGERVGIGELGRLEGLELDA